MCEMYKNSRKTLCEVQEMHTSCAVGTPPSPGMQSKAEIKGLNAPPPQQGGLPPVVKSLPTGVDLPPPGKIPPTHTLSYFYILLKRYSEFKPTSSSSVIIKLFILRKKGVPHICRFFRLTTCNTLVLWQCHLMIVDTLTCHLNLFDK